MAVNDETGPQIIIGQLLPDVVRMAINLRVRSIAKMGRKPRSGERRSGDLSRSRRSVADGDDDACGGGPFDEIYRVRPFGRERNDANTSARGVLPFLEFVPIRRARVLFRMRAARPVFGRDERPFDMD